jgi:EAL domain-containing protein (putative c-di-GMP-specific phosphodiesterase class I)
MSGKEFDPQLQKLDDELAGWSEPAERLRQALNKDELALYCQPIAALTGPVRFPMAEVLIRLREEEKALLPPGEFLPVFEHYRLMPDLDRWVVRKMVQHIARGSRIPRFTVNVSSQTLEDPAFPKAVALELVSAGVPGTALLFEISENDALARLEAATRFSTAVRAVGCGIIVSGFGRRTATFMPLKTLRPDYVKVDGVIVRKLLSAPSAEAKLKAILRVGEVMGFQVIAEMVEDQDILVRLKALGVGYAQGFGIQEPHPIELIGGQSAAT